MNRQAPVIFTLLFSSGCSLLGIGGGKWDTGLADGVDACPHEELQGTWQYDNTAIPRIFVDADPATASMFCTLENLQYSLILFAADDAGHELGLWDVEGNLTLQSSTTGTVIDTGFFGDRLIDGYGTVVVTRTEDGAVTLEFYEGGTEHNTVNATAKGFATETAITLTSLSGDPTGFSTDAMGCNEFNFDDITESFPLRLDLTGPPGATAIDYYNEFEQLYVPGECTDEVLDTGDTGDTGSGGDTGTTAEGALYRRILPPPPSNWAFPSVPSTMLSYAWLMYWEAPPTDFGGVTDPAALQAWRVEMHEDWDVFFTPVLGITPFSVMGGDQFIAPFAQEGVNVERVRMEGHRYIEWLVIAPYARQMMGEITNDWESDNLANQEAVWYFGRVLQGAPPPPPPPGQ